MIISQVTTRPQHPRSANLPLATLSCQPYHEISPVVSAAEAGFMPFLLSGVNITLATILILAAGSKVRNVGIFAEQIADYRLIPYRLTRPTALIIILSELAAASLLLTAQAHFAGAVLASVLFLVFLSAMISAWRHGRQISC